VVDAEKSMNNMAESTDLEAKHTNADIFTAVILAGSRNAHDPVAAIFGEHYKALVPILGTPMVLRVVEALRKASSIKRIVIVFDCQDTLFSSCSALKALSEQVDISVVPCGNTICGSVVNALDATGHDWPYMVTTADHALLTPCMVDSFCSSVVGKNGLAVGLVEKKYLDAQHPNSKRTYLPFKETKLSGANLFAFMDQDAMKGIAFWKRIEQERKKPWRLFAAFGWRSLFGFAFKRFTVDQAFEQVSKRLGVSAIAVRLPYAEAAIDVDSPKDYAQVSKILESRGANSPTGAA